MKRKQGKYNSNHKNSVKVEKTVLGKSPLHSIVRSSFRRRFEVLVGKKSNVKVYQRERLKLTWFWN